MKLPTVPAPEGKLRVVCIFDENDFNTSTYERNSGKIEQELRGQDTNTSHVVSVLLATPSSLEEVEV